MKERFNISQSPICLAWNWSLFRWISPTKHLHWSGPVSPSRSMVDAQDATETSSVTPCQQKLNFRVCSQWPKSSQKPDRSVLVFSLCAHSVSQTCDLAYRNHYFRRWSSIRTHAHSQIHMFIDCTFYICIFLCTHTFESQNDVDGKADSIQTLWNRASLIQVSLLVATGMVASLKSQLSCLVSRQTWSIMEHLNIDMSSGLGTVTARGYHVSKREECPVLLVFREGKQLLLWTCFKSWGCTCECRRSHIRSAYRHFILDLKVNGYGSRLGPPRRIR